MAHPTFKPVTVLLAAVLLCFAQPAFAGAAPTPKPAPKAALKTAPTALRVLPNGMRVLVVEDHLAPVVETAVYYGFGAYDETPGKTGLAHALEHMMFRGTPSLSGEGLTDAMGQLGATINAATFADYTRYYFVIPAEKLDLALHIEADRMQNLALRAADWQLERGAVLTEIIGKSGSPGGQLRKAILEAAYGKESRYALDVAGITSDVEHATVEDLRAYYERWYAPNNATLVVTGDVQPAAVFAAARTYFAGIPRRAIPAHERPAPELHMGQTVSIHGDFAFGNVTIAYPFVGDVGGVETDAASLLPSIINNIRSPFYRDMVQNGYAFGVSAYADTTLHNGLLYITLTPKPPHSPEVVVAAFERTMAQFLADGPSADLIAAAKAESATSDTFARDSIPGLGYLEGYVVGYEMHNDPLRDTRAIARVTPADVAAAARKYFARPAVVGTIVADGKQRTSATPPPRQINDDFTSRESTGQVVQAPWVQTAISGALVASNRTRPVEFRLQNGIRVFVQHLGINPTVYISGSIRGSSKFDPDGKEGMGAITTTLMGFGSKKYDFNARSKLQDQLSANITIGQGFSAYGLSKDFTTLVDVVADGIRNPAYPDQYFALIKNGFLTAISRREHNSDYRAGRTVLEMLAPPGDPTLRQPSTLSVSSITKADLQAYHDAYIRPDLTTITVVGDVSVAQARAVLTKYFGDWNAPGPKPDISLDPLPLRPAQMKQIETEGTTVSATLAQPAPARKSPDFYALLLLNTILGSGGELTTRLMQDLRVHHGLVYSVSSDYSAQQDRGILEFHVSATPEHMKEAIARLKAEITRAQTEPPTETELARAKKYIIGQTLVGEDSIAGIASAINNIGTNDLPLDYYQTRNAIFNSITAADVLRVAKLYLKPNNLAEVYEGPAF